jgi:hypothetical protein
MKKNVFVMLLLSLAWMSTAYAASNATPMPGILANARFVYVTAYDGDQFDPRLLPEDRAAIGRAEDGLPAAGCRCCAGAVESRPSEDVLAVYDAHSGPSQNYLWRVMGRGGLQKTEMPLFSQFEKAWDKIAH